jgi:hypothetical protein
VDSRDDVEEGSLSLQENMARATELNDLMSTPFTSAARNGVIPEVSDVELEEELDNLMGVSRRVTHTNSVVVSIPEPKRSKIGEESSLVDIPQYA